MGITRIYDLFENGRFKSIESLKAQYHILNKDFAKNLQVRHYVYKKASSLEFSNDSHQLEMFFPDHKEQKHFISKFYSKILSLNLDKFTWLRTSWCTLLKCVMNDMCDEILQLPSRISICSGYKEQQYNILHKLEVHQISKCKTHVGTRLHYMWECDKIKSVLRAICANISTAIGQQVSANLLLLCLL